jgi:hypothetical protein
MEYLIFPFAAFVGGGVLGYWLCAHIHSVAAKATEAAQRAVTVPAGDVAKLNAAVAGLGDQVQKASADLKSHVSATVNAAVAALPQAPAAPKA